MEKYVLLATDKDNCQFIWSFKEDNFGDKWFSFEDFSNELDSFKAVLFDDIESVKILINNLSNFNGYLYQKYTFSIKRLNIYIEDTF